MQRKAIIIQVLLLGATMVLGILLKLEAYTGARMLHRNAGIFALLATLITMIITISHKASRTVAILIIVAFAATLTASTGGNLTRTSRQNLGYGIMLASFSVAVVCSAASLFVLKHEAKDHS